MDFWRNNPKQRRCRADDVNPDWWIATDLSGEERNDGTHELQRSNDDLARAKALCYECPLLFACREASWDEPAHVWGGLTAIERFRARQVGHLPPLEAFSSRSPQSTALRVTTLFLSGADANEIVKQLGISYTTARRHIIILAKRARVLRERRTPSITPIPPLTPTSEANYLLVLRPRNEKRVRSLNSLEESA